MTPFLFIPLTNLKNENKYVVVFDAAGNRLIDGKVMVNY